MSAILSFLGGGAFRAIWGEFSTWMTARQEHKYEMQRMQVQGTLDAAQHARNLESVRVQAELGVKTIQVQADADLARTDADAFVAAMKTAQVPTGVKWVDAWNGVIRPAFATVVLMLWVRALGAHGWVLVAWDLEMMGSIAGFFFADRMLGKRSK